MSRSTARKIIAEKKSAPCADCGRSFDPVCMDFDHRPDEEKLGNIGSFLYDEHALRIEISKCDVVCACCHRLRTKLRGVSSKTKQKIKDAWSCPDRRARQSLKLRSSDVSTRRAISIKIATSSPEFRQKMREIAARTAAQKSEKMKEIWARKRLEGLK